jgi:hypothetical protein
MVRTALSFPVLPGKSDKDVKSIAEACKSRPREYEESRRRLGITLERAYLQKTPMGDFVVAYLESEKEFNETSRLLAQSKLDFDRFFVNTVKDVHGVDMTQVPEERPETIGLWFDPQVTTRGKGLAFCAPLLPDKIDAGRRFTSEAFSSSEFAASRRAFGDNGEVVTLLPTPQGPIVAVYLEGVDPIEANRRFAASREPFDVWFKEQCALIFPPFVDFSKPIEGLSEIFDSTKVASLGLGAERKVA